MRQIESGKRPFFNRGKDGGSGNAGTIEMLKKLGAEVKKIGD